MGITPHLGLKRLLNILLAVFLFTSGTVIRPAFSQVSPSPDGRIILITVDGLRSDVIQSFGPELLPGFHRLMQEGSSTLNARPDPEFSLTLPNHTSMFTGRYVGDLRGHNWYENTDVPTTETLHNKKGAYVASLFDVVHDHGGRTGLFTTKSKFSLFDQSFNEQNGALDQTGADNGRDKIDTFYLSTTTTDLLREFRTISSTNPFKLAVFHIAETDVAGHAKGWSKDPSSAYGFAVRMADLLLQELMMEVDSNPLLTGQTHIIMTADHGGDGPHHSNPKTPSTFTVPFMTWGPDVLAGSDLYALNASRTDPGNRHISLQASLQTPPVRNADIANLSLSLLGLPSIEGSTINPDQDMVINATTVVNPGQPIEIAFQSGSFPESTYSGATDTKLLSDAPSTTFGSATSLEMDGYPSYKGLLGWDISEIPTTATLVSAQITVDVTNVSGNEYGLFEMNRPWSEQEANWQMASSGASWTTPGASDSTDRNTLLLGSLTPNVLGTDTMILNAAGLRTIQNWISNPDLNYGFVIENASGGDDGLDISSREVAEVSKRPKLTLVYVLENSPISNSAPIASFSNDPIGRSAPVSVNFDATESFDLDGLIVDYDWDFGDGTVGSGSNPAHTFTESGPFLVQLTVTDDLGATTQTERSIVIESNNLESMSFQNGVFPDVGYDGAIDTKLMADSPETVFGSAAMLEIDGYPRQSALLKWDISSIPQAASILSVSLIVDITNPSYDTYEMYGLSSAWSEAGASWIETGNGSSWQTPGAFGSGDYMPDIIGYVGTQSMGMHTFPLNGQGLSLVQQWVNAPESNHGLIIQDYSEAWDGIDFHSSEASSASSRPKLVIEYATTGVSNRTVRVSSDTGESIDLLDLATTWTAGSIQGSDANLLNAIRTTYRGFHFLNGLAGGKNEVRLEVAENTSSLLVIPESDSLLAIASNANLLFDRSLVVNSLVYNVYVSVVKRGSHSIQIPEGASFYVQGKPSAVSLKGEEITQPERPIKGISAFPNPFSTHLTLQVPTSENAEVELLDMLGRRVSLIQIDGNTTRIDTEHLPRGTYVLRYTSPELQKRSAIVTKGI